MSDLAARASATALAAFVLASSVLTGCGGDGGTSGAAGEPSASPTGSSAASASASATASPSGGATPGGGTASGGATTGPGASQAPHGGATPHGTHTPGATPSTRPTTTQIVLNASLSKTCVKPGEPMTLTVLARPRMKVIFNTSYPDGKDGSVHGGHDTSGQTDANGRYANTWTVSPAAGTGDARVLVAAVDEAGTGQRSLPFRIALAC